MADEPLPGLLIEAGWQPVPSPLPGAETILARTIERLLPMTRGVLWNVRDDLSVTVLAEVMAERMRLLGSAKLWQDVEVLEAQLAAARAEAGAC